MKKSEFKNIIREAAREQLNEAKYLGDELMEIKGTLRSIIRELPYSQAKAKSTLQKSLDLIAKAIDEFMNDDK